MQSRCSLLLWKIRAKSQIIPNCIGHITLHVIKIYLCVLECLEFSLQKVHESDLNK